MIQILSILISSIIVLACTDNSQTCEQLSYKSIEFEVYGKVQGVYFRKYTQLKAQELEIVGWVQNTKKGTVIGIAQGYRINEFKDWLENVGSPKSKIQKVNFGNEHNIEELDYDTFDIIK